MQNETPVPKKALQAARGHSVAAKAAHAKEGMPQLLPAHAGSGSQRAVLGAEGLRTGGTGD